ncbi:MAG: response regulator [Nitrospirae bacterium]|nr:response regulator [Nitrospirota bacterium]
MTAEKPAVLCVDDEQVNLRFLEAVLVPRGYRVLRAENGKIALDIIREQKVDLVLLDVMMPLIDGYEVCRQIKESELYRSIPVIMTTALNSKDDRIKGIEVGADDFISKPCDQGELLARIKMLLKIKSLNDRLNSAYAKINSLTCFGEEIMKTFDPLNFDFLSKIDTVVGQIIRRADEDIEKPQIIVIGISDKDRGRQWFRYGYNCGTLHREVFPLNLHRCLVTSGEEPRTSFTNIEDIGSSDIQPILKMVEATGTTVSNVVSYHSIDICIHAFNYGGDVTGYEASVLNSIVMQSLFLKSLSSQVRETENAFEYLVYALARAAEANDEDTGNHILRVGEYCALLGRQLGMSEKFNSIIRLQATLHDVGKIHISPAILKKPGKLTPEEFDEIKKHTIYGGNILGEHVRLTLAKNTTLAHHERWDGTGYPHGLREKQIPFEGRILNITDQYDALRNQRTYKPAFDHVTTFRIITEGDGRTLPCHFDPDILRAFKAAASQFEEVYEQLRG